eukprot:1628015-Pleurochrysis_carterae.AAC.1
MTRTRVRQGPQPQRHACSMRTWLYARADTCMLAHACRCTHACAHGGEERARASERARAPRPRGISGARIGRERLPRTAAHRSGAAEQLVSSDAERPVVHFERVARLRRSDKRGIRNCTEIRSRPLRALS